MGYPYHELIPVAILLENPGITIEEFVELLDKTHGSPYREYKEDPRWDYYDIKDDEKWHHEGLDGLAEMLHIKYTKKFREFQTPKTDENGLYLRPPWLVPGNIAGDIIEKKAKGKPHVIVHAKNVLHEPKGVDQLSWDKLKLGDVWEECQMGSEIGLVEKIIKEESFGNHDEDEDMSGPRYKYVMIIRPIEKVFDEQRFENMEELLKKWPQFEVRNKYNLRQKKGNFAFAENFIWEKKKGRYYLSNETYNKIPISGILEKGYNDLILTAEAIKHKAWKLVSYRGLQHLPRFLHDFHDSRKRYENAVIDGELSMFAMKKGMTITDYLRFRVENMIRK